MVIKVGSLQFAVYSHYQIEHVHFCYELPPRKLKFPNPLKGAWIICSPFREMSQSDRGLLFILFTVLEKYPSYRMKRSEVCYLPKQDQADSSSFQSSTWRGIIEHCSFLLWFPPNPLKGIWIICSPFREMSQASEATEGIIKLTCSFLLRF